MEDSSNSNISSSENKESEQKWDITYENEKKYWDDNLLGEYIYISHLCPSCKKNTLELKEHTNNNIINPYYLRCSRKKCRKIVNIRKCSFFKLHNKIPASILHFIIKEFILMKSCGVEIQKRINKQFKYNMNYKTLLNILMNLRKVIADYLKNKYRSNRIGGDPSTEIVVAVDECLFEHEEDGSQIWIVGAIETESRKKRFDILPNRSSVNLKKFAVNHILPGTHITHDGWRGYNFWGDDELLCTEEIHDHGGGDFGTGKNSTSNIEHTWSHMKNQIKNIYNIIPKTNFIYYFREAEFRLNLSKKTDSQKENYFKKVLKYVYEMHEYEFYSEEEIYDFDNYDI